MLEQLLKFLNEDIVLQRAEQEVKNVQQRISPVRHLEVNLQAIVL